jgi:hypothetical protein
MLAYAFIVLITFLTGRRHGLLAAGKESDSCWQQPHLEPLLAEAHCAGFAKLGLPTCPRLIASDIAQNCLEG